MQWPQLHTHSAFSFEDGADHPEDLASEAARLEIPTLALTDHNGLWGGIRFVAACRRQGVQPILGAEVELCNRGHLTLLAETARGYANLSGLLTRAHMEAARACGYDRGSGQRPRPQVQLAWLADMHDGLIALSGCRLSWLVYLVRAGRLDDAREWLAMLRDLMGPRHLYVELQNLLRPGDRWIVSRLQELAGALHLPLVATGNVHHATWTGFAIHDLLSCARLEIPVDTAHPLRPINAMGCLAFQRDWGHLYADIPEALENTREIAARCSFDPFPPGRTLFPAYPCETGESSEQRLRRQVREGALQRYRRITPQIRKRLAYELSVICQLGYADYFLTVWDIAHWASAHGIRHAGRGSAADSAVAYCLYLTRVDPIRRGLPFERFLSMERSQQPDVDIDFDRDRREEVFHYVRDRFGERHVAMVCTYATYRGRSAARLVGGALGIAPDLVSRLAKRIPFHCSADRVAEAFVRAPELAQSGLKLEQVTLWVRLCARLAGLPSYTSTHLGGIIVACVPIESVVPVSLSPMGRRVAQVDKEDVENAGLIKIDLLSLGMLAAMEQAERQLQVADPSFDTDRIPYEDPGTFGMIRSGQTIGAFQIESPAQRALHLRLNSDTQNDIDVSVALIRPGPLCGNMVDPFVSRRNGEQPVTYLHPDLEPILRHTCGVPVYQEQIIQIASLMAGYTPGEADQLRKTMTKNRSAEEMERLCAEFVERSIGRGYSSDIAQKMYEWIRGFVGFGFCEAHAASFGDTAYKSAWMLHHHPDVFLAAVMSCQPMGYYSVATLANQARVRGVSILPLHLNESEDRCTAQSGCIRLGFCLVGGMRAEEREEIVTERQLRGPYSSVQDLVVRTALKRDTLERLALAGAFDWEHTNRRLWLRRIPGLLTLRGAQGLLGMDQPEPAVADTPDYSPWERYLNEWQAVGVVARGHLMNHLRPLMNRLGAEHSRQLSSIPGGAVISVGGLVVSPHRPATRSGRRVMFFSLEDEHGLTDCALFEPAYMQYGHLVMTAPVVVVTGELARRGRGASLVVQHVQPIDNTQIQDAVNGVEAVC